MKQLWLISLVMIGAMRPEWQEIERLPHSGPQNPGLRCSLVIFSDPHYYNPDLGTTGAAFEDYLNNDRKLLRESSRIMEKAAEIISGIQPNLILVPGDLTKDGSLQSHRAFIRHLERLEALGSKVFVVPGNHDVSNGEALAYRGDSSERVANVDPALFAHLYGPFGYEEALYRDPASLSYIAEPIKNLWIIGLDACLYAQNDSLGHPLTGGELKEESLTWLKSKLETEQAQGKTKLALMHHGILEHFHKQKKYFGEYVLNDYRKVSRKLSSWGVPVVFTGHYHANDISLKRWKDGSFLYDIETGSLVTYPCPIRKAELRNDSLLLESIRIRQIDGFETGFTDFARNYAMEGVARIAEETLVEMNVPLRDARYLSGQIGDVYTGHYRGDEIFREPPLNLDSVGLKGRFFISFRKKLVRGLTTDLPPADNRLGIHLPSGGYCE